MKGAIKGNINNPEELERLYREDRKSFEREFNMVYPELENSEIVKYWKIRVDFDKSQGKLTGFPGSEIYKMIVICLISAILIKIPALFNLDLNQFFFYEKNAGIIFFLGLTLYSISINRSLTKEQLYFVILAFIIPILYINLLPSEKNSASINLAYIHLPLLMWCIYGLVYLDFNTADIPVRIKFIRHNGDLAILGALILIAGGVLTVITFGLFNAININIQKFYMETVVMVGIVSAPVITAFIIRNYSTFTSKIAPIIANIFSPLVLLTLVIYLIAVAVTGKDPFNDRDFLLIFNIMLLGVMAIIVFSVSETSLHLKQRFNELILLTLSIITIIIDLLALSAIIYWLVEFGISPNRMAVAGSNILILVNLIQIMIDLFKINFSGLTVDKVEMTISRYLPVYIIWIVIVIFGFPLIFGFN